MSELMLVHRVGPNQTSNGEVTPSLLVWKTCRRQIFFFDRAESASQFAIQPSDEIHVGIHAEVFLAEVLCGLHSPLVGETEVFGQFKNWWKDLPPALEWKSLHRPRIEALFALVKNVREKVLCGFGSQSYGSLLRKYLSGKGMVDIVGAGHLVHEILPWIESKAQYRIWCRDPQRANFPGATSILSMTDKAELSKSIVIAAPLSHNDLDVFLSAHHMSKEHSLFDFRSISHAFTPSVQPRVHLMLNDFSTQSHDYQNTIQPTVQRARTIIAEWKLQQETKAQLRPYGWDDL
jgi:glutamyl-tRNA reductase